MGKTNGQSERSSALTTTSAAVDAELRRYVELTAVAVKVPLTSEKNLERAVKAIEEAAECEKRVLGHVQALVQAVGTARDTQQESAATLNARLDAIAERRAQLEPLLARFGQLGEAAKTLNVSLQKIATYKPNPYAAEEAREFQEALQAVEAGMVACVGHAQQLATDATAGEFEELGRQADALRQQVLAAKNRLSLLQKGLGAS